MIIILSVTFFFFFFCLVATCDLQFEMDRERYGGRPLFHSTFPCLWSGSRATHGVMKGNVYFEVKRTDNLPLSEGYSEFPLLRVGWSVARSGPQLGEDDLSFAYDSRGLKATSSHFEAYGKSFGEHDVIGCYANLDGDSVELSFSKNGEDLGQAFHFKKSSLGNHALLPHILCKGCAFQVNFGQKLKPWHKSREGFCFLHDLKSEDLIRTPVPPRCEYDCEMLMMVGYPASGKTTWVLKHIQENPDKNYIHLSVDRFIPQVKTVGLDKTEDNNKVKDLHVKLATQCLNRALEIASYRKANYIIDQCSVYKTSQFWKLQCFCQFKSKAVLLVTTEEEWKRRLEVRRKEGEVYPEAVLYHMIVHFWTPKIAKMPLDDIIFPEFNKKLASSLLYTLMDNTSRLLVKKSGKGPKIRFIRSRENILESLRPRSYVRPTPLIPPRRPHPE
uniref:B30.2/SPRY domain-containing protein n=1 Tax=Leptobrachium leishanense TaxID=445787 RepID=A0A8C5Q655_9ANUR